ncbi:putative deoxynucleoside monophosphate kinase [Bacillus phage JBP901]|uniref:Putative deoxynucleoside monophosphate kinase n=2 Tax=Caeruleovirus TaxID=1911929 RepID=A0A0E3DEP8_9CAUD|nr:putative deoxynucleoside monophosphate kinase [Bacillus phage JBP901]YP_009149608.1 putative deoxynucleoside monophosphate kinase [Bacillus phage BCP8-2]AHJ87085.1 putative deoxynucleoside monophosphate kinase [Bacillus phage BCP8-2]AID17733.1 putative deoxynucleoside monophosphate kinase [Bacillus phage JBP901]
MKEVKIAIAGEFRSGKSTVADYLDSTYGMLQFAFADELKKDFHKEYPDIPMVPKPRKGYQLYGQLMRYVHGEEYWINKCFNKIHDVRLLARNYNTTGLEMKFSPVITDLRQENELERCREAGYFIIKVIAPEEVRIKRAEEAGDAFSLEEMNHETETYVREMYADYTIVNKGSLAQLYGAVDVVMGAIKMRMLREGVRA